ncbi:CaiF/GrlA family transcriptional regulator [Pantoea sp. 1.19]|uniref:CaiF/GrlA family transcriptional regulator n=1 Tax=Pantoea sp. 1.19 TaxID=1925589 RepID=UPI0009489D99|nr:CaiF/GrlA family transcriptional regulator [Pantoea sp. 1.19]
MSDKLAGHPERRKAHQSNHGDSVVPYDVRQWADQPLYMLVAIWCSLQKRWISRQEIANEFNIDKRRASFLISYILKKKERIQCKTRITSRQAPWFCQHEVLIEQVSLEEDKSELPANALVRGARRRRVGNASAEDWRWLLTRTPPAKQ